MKKNIGGSKRLLIDLFEFAKYGNILFRNIDFFDPGN